MIIVLCACGQKHINEWVEKEGNKYYYDETGQIVRNCKKLVDGLWYAFDENGHLVISKVVNYDGKSYITDGAGLLKKNGWYKHNGNWYYLKNYLLQSGWVEDEGSWYYLNLNTYILCKNQWIDGMYYCGNDGAMVKNGWYNIGSERLYFDNNGIVDRDKLNITFKNIPFVDRLYEFSAEKDIYCTIDSIYFEGKNAWCKGKLEDKKGQNYPLMDIMIFYNIYDSKGRQVVSSERIDVKFTQRKSKYFEVPFNFPFGKIDKNDNYIVEITHVGRR